MNKEDPAKKKVRASEYYRKNRDRILARQASPENLEKRRRSRANSPEIREKERIANRKYQEEHREELLAYGRKYRASHSEERRLYYESHIKEIKEYNAARYASNPDIHRERGLKRHYGITTKQYNELFERQRGVCAICGCAPSGGGTNGRTLCVDHDHKTGMVRGLLCASCNRGIGSMGDSVKIVRCALEYLETTGGKENVDTQ